MTDVKYDKFPSEALMGAIDFNVFNITSNSSCVATTNIILVCIFSIPPMSMPSLLIKSYNPTQSIIKSSTF